MRTSVPGSERGFTLVELIVVVAIVGVALAFASLNLTRSAANAAQLDSERIVALLNAARDRALATGSARWVVWDGAQLAMLTAREQTPDASAKPVAPEQLSLTSFAVAGAPREAPVIRFDASGWATPFVMQWSNASGTRVDIRGDAVGTIRAAAAS